MADDHPPGQTAKHGWLMRKWGGEGSECNSLLFEGKLVKSKGLYAVLFLCPSLVYTMQLSTLCAVWGLHLTPLHCSPPTLQKLHFRSAVCQQRSLVLYSPLWEHVFDVECLRIMEGALDFVIRTHRSLRGRGSVCCLVQFV